MKPRKIGIKAVLAVFFIAFSLTFSMQPSLAANDPNEYLYSTSDNVSNQDNSVSKDKNDPTQYLFSTDDVANDAVPDQSAENKDASKTAKEAVSEEIGSSLMRLLVNNIPTIIVIGGILLALAIITRKTKDVGKRRKRPGL